MICIFSNLFPFSNIIQILIFPYKEASYIFLAGKGTQTISTTSSDVQSSRKSRISPELVGLLHSDFAVLTVKGPYLGFYIKYVGVQLFPLNPKVSLEVSGH